MTTATLPTDNETLQLSAIYRELLDELDELMNAQLPTHQYDQAIELVSETVGQAVRILTARCPDCDSSDIRIICGDCDPYPNE